MRSRARLSNPLCPIEIHVRYGKARAEVGQGSSNRPTDGSGANHERDLTGQVEDAVEPARGRLASTLPDIQRWPGHLRCVTILD